MSSHRPKRSKTAHELYDYQLQAIEEMVEAERRLPHLKIEISGQQVELNFRKKHGVLNLEPGTGKTAVCLARLCRWLEEGLGHTVPPNTLAVHPQLALGLCPRETGLPSDWHPPPLDLLANQKNYFQRMRPKADGSLQAHIVRGIVQRQLDDLEWARPRPLRPRWPARYGPNSRMRELCPCSWPDANCGPPCIHNEESCPTWIWDTSSLVFPECATSLVLVPPKLYKQWCVAVTEFVPARLRHHFVTTVSKEPVPRPGRTVYIVGRADIPPSWVSVLAAPHDLIFQDEAHLAPRRYLKALRYNFFWGLSASMQKLETPAEARMSAWLAHCLHTLAIDTWWAHSGEQALVILLTGRSVRPAETRYRDSFGHLLPYKLEGMFASYQPQYAQTTVSFANFLESASQDDVWGMWESVSLMFNCGLGNLSCIAPPGASRLMIGPRWHTVRYKLAAAEYVDSAETLVQLYLMEPANRRQRLVSIARARKTQKWIEGLGVRGFEGEDGQGIVRILSEIALHGLLRVEAGTARQLEHWGVLAKPALVWAELAKLLAEPGQEPGQHCGRIVEWRLALRKLAARVIEHLEHLYESQWQSQIEERLSGLCGVCLDSGDTNLVTCCCLQPICLECATHISATCPFCRQEWAISLSAWKASPATGRLLAFAPTLYNTVAQIVVEQPQAKILAITSFPEDLDHQDCIPLGVAQNTMASGRSALSAIEHFRRHTSLLLMNERILNYGLNLQFVSHLLLLGPVSDEKQVIGRVCRLGRQDAAHIYRFVPVAQ